MMFVKDAADCLILKEEQLRAVIGWGEVVILRHLIVLD